MKYARIRPDRLRAHHPSYYHRWLRVYDRHPNGGEPSSPGYIWVQGPSKVQAMRAEDLEIREAKEETDRRGRDRLKDGDLEITAMSNAGGGVIVKVLHLPSRRFATESGNSRELAERKAKATLAGILVRMRP